jgi:predicted dehydrogenase
MRQPISRREFTKRSLLAGAALAATRPAIGALGANEKIRVGIIGCRTRGHQDASTFLRTGRFDIATLCDCDTAMLNAALRRLDDKLPRKPKLEQDFRKVLDDPGVDAIVNTTPDHWHALITVLALEAGKHVYVEKPACYNIQDGLAMIAARRRHPKLGQVGFARAWFTTNRGTVPIVPDGQPPKGFDYDLWVGPAPMHPFNKAKTHYNWHFVRDFGTGDMGNWGAHWLDSIRHLLDLDVPTAAMATGGTYVVHDAKEFPDTQTVLYEYPHMTLLWELREWSPYPITGDMDSGIEIRGQKGVLLINRSGWSFHPYKGEPQSHKGTEQELHHANNFADCITGDATPAAAIEQGYKTCVLIHLGNIATFTRHRLEWDAAANTIKDDPQAAKLLGREYRAPWKLPAMPAPGA